jgi:hypothetical protein
VNILCGTCGSVVTRRRYRRQKAPPCWMCLNNFWVWYVGDKGERETGVCPICNRDGHKWPVNRP